VGFVFCLQFGFEVGQVLIRLVFLVLKLGLGVLLDLFDLGIKGSPDDVKVLFFEVLEFMHLLVVVFVGVGDGVFFSAVVGYDPEHHRALVDVFCKVGFGEFPNGIGGAPHGDVEDDLIVDLVTDLVFPLGEFVLKQSNLTVHEAKLGIVYVLTAG
jgi:hypothetical protein